MKTYHILLLVALFSACSMSQSTTQKKYQLKKLSSDEMAQFTTKGKSVYYADEKVASVSSLEYEYYNGDYLLEVSMIQHSASYNDMTQKLVYFMSSTYPHAKIEVKVERDAKEVYGLNLK